MLYEIEQKIIDSLKKIDLEKNHLKSALDSFDNKESNTIILGFILQVKLETVNKVLTDIKIYTSALKGLYADCK